MELREAKYRVLLFETAEIPQWFKQEYNHDSSSTIKAADKDEGEHGGPAEERAPSNTSVGE